MNTFLKSIVPILFGVLFGAIFLYTFGFNFFVFMVLSMAVAFLINAGLPIGDKFPFFRFSLIYFVLLFSQTIVIRNYIFYVRDFYDPSIFWALLLISSFVFGLIGKFGKFGRGTMSQSIHGLGIMLNLLTIVLCLVFFWWKGAVAFILIRLFLSIIENFVSGIVFIMLYESGQRKFNEQEYNAVD